MGPLPQPAPGVAPRSLAASLARAGASSSTAPTQPSLRPRPTPPRTACSDPGTYLTLLSARVQKAQTSPGIAPQPKRVLQSTVPLAHRVFYIPILLGHPA